MKKLSMFLVLAFALPLLAACCGDCPRCPGSSTTVVTPPGQHMIVTPAD